MAVVETLFGSSYGTSGRGASAESQLSAPKGEQLNIADLLVQVLQELHLKMQYKPMVVTVIFQAQTLQT